jgi:hypothetical protein
MAETLTLSSAALRAFLAEHGTVSETELARQFRTTPAVIAMMAERLEGKGQLSLLERTEGGISCGCSGSCGCGSTHAEKKRFWRLA